MSDASRLADRLAAAVADFEAIDWRVVPRASARHFETLARLADGSRSRSSASIANQFERVPVRPPAWMVGLLLVASINVLSSLVIWLITPDDRQAVPAASLILAMAVLSGTGTVLVLGGQRDRRAVYLGAFFLVTAAALTPRFLGRLQPVALIVDWWRSLCVDAYMPLMLWLFVRDFPRLGRFTRFDRIARLAIAGAVVAGGILMAANLATGIAPTLRPYLQVLERSGVGFLYWGVIMGMMLPAFPVAVARAREAPEQERRRVRLFITAFAVFGTPFLLEILLEIVFPSFFVWMSQPYQRFVGALVLFGSLSAIPIVCAYAILVDDVFDVRIVVRRAVRYTLKRYVLVVVAMTPVLVVVAYAVGHRDQALEDLLASKTAASLVILSVIGIALLVARGPILEWLEGRLGLQLDYREALASFGRQIADARDVPEIASLLGTHTARVFGVEQAVVLAYEAERRTFLPVFGAARPLPVESGLGALVSTAGSVVNIDPYEKRSLFQLLTVGDREWVLDGGYSLIVTIGPADRPSTGLLLLGRKSSDAPFSREDQLFAIGLAATAALAVENATARSLVKSAPAEAEHDLRDEPAAECRLCGIVQSSGAATCARCRGQLSAAALPLVVLGKFKLECVLGRGGMGIVYRARDLALDRAVAIKTLPRLSADAARRMRREARTMALVTHPHLAVIHGAESWRGTPLLIVELLEGGTLSDRLLRERLTIDEALDLGMTISAALARVHDGGVLHRDIKPSNIGYMHDGTAKVLDFGLARLIESGAPQARPDLSARGAAQTDQFATSSASGLGPWRPAGTPAYMSPEAISGRRPEPSFDLWSLAVVLFEAIAGENPFRARSIARTFALIEDLTPDRLCNRLGPVPDPVVAFFKRTLAHSVVERPSSARHFGEEVRRCREALKLPHSVV